MESNYIVHKDLVRIQHLQHKGFLTDSGVSYKNGYIVGLQPNPVVGSIWIIEKFCPPQQGIQPVDYTNTEVWPGDLIVIRSKQSSQVLTSNAENSSPVSGGGEVLLSNWFDNAGEQVFVIQSDVRNYNKIRIINIGDTTALHSHQKKYKNPKDWLEVIGYQKRDDNDYWTIIPAELQGLNIQAIERQLQPRVYKFVHHMDKLVIRNMETGGTLHSHTSCYTHGNKSQEVTWRQSAKRDQNDWWQIIVQSENQEITNQIPNNSTIGLMHMGTKSRLTHIKDARVKNKDYLEVTCGQPTFNEFQIEGIDHGIANLHSLITEYPFRIRHVPTNQYLIAVGRQSSKSTFQGQIALAPVKDNSTIWVVEQIDSIFD